MLNMLRALNSEAARPWEALLRSESGEIEILPNLPTELTEMGRNLLIVFDCIGHKLFRACCYPGSQHIRTQYLFRQQD